MVARDNLINYIRYYKDEREEGNGKKITVVVNKKLMLCFRFYDHRTVLGRAVKR